jgi:creatinine amidohydrolase
MRRGAAAGCVGAFALVVASSCGGRGVDGAPPPTQKVAVKPSDDAAARPKKGALLEDLTWLEAEKRLTPDAVVVIPIGAAAKEHGPHLLLKNDLLIADYMRDRVVEQADVVVAPTVNYHFYPAFREYPGSTSLRLETARDLMIDVVTSLAAFGPRRFYALNTGVSTVRALAPVVDALAAQGIVFRFTDLKTILGPLEKEIAKQPGGSHADEIETSMMLVIAPATVDMSKAVKDFDPNGGGGLTRKQGTGVTYSPTGIWGDPTLATREKGERVVAAYVTALLAEIEATRAAPLPAATVAP